MASLVLLCRDDDDEHIFFIIECELYVVTLNKSRWSPLEHYPFFETENPSESTQEHRTTPPPAPPILRLSLDRGVFGVCVCMPPTP